MSKRKSSANKSNVGSSQSQKAKTASQPTIDLDPFTRDFGDGLHSTSLWHLDWVEPFCDLQFKSGIGFAKQDLENVKLFPEETLFAKCSATRDDIVNGTWELGLSDVDELKEEDPQIRFVFREHRRLLKEKVDASFENLRGILRQHAIPKEGLELVSKSEMGVDALAHQLGVLCGFNDGEFLITYQSVAFKFAGKEINSNVDVYAAKRTSEGVADQLVLIWADKLSAGNSGKVNTTASMLESSAAQIIGEMISVHYQNTKKFHFGTCEVYAIRLIDDKVAFFRMEMTAEQIEDVCEKGVIPNRKLQV